MSGNDSHHQNQNYAAYQFLNQHQHTDQAFHIAPMASSTTPQQYILMQQQPAQQGFPQVFANGQYYQYVPTGQPMPQQYIPQAIQYRASNQHLLQQQHIANAYHPQQGIQGDVNAAQAQHFQLPGNMVMIPGQLPVQFTDPNLQYSIRGPYADQLFLSQPNFIVPTLTVPTRPQMTQRPTYNAQQQQQQAQIYQMYQQAPPPQATAPQQPTPQQQMQAMPTVQQVQVQAPPPVHQAAPHQPVVVPQPAAASQQTPLQQPQQASVPQTPQQQPPQAQQSQTAPPPHRAKKMIKIEDPNTGKEVDLQPSAAAAHPAAATKPTELSTGTPAGTTTVTAALSAAPVTVDEVDRKSPGAMSSPALSTTAQPTAPSSAPAQLQGAGGKKSNVALQFAAAVSQRLAEPAAKGETAKPVESATVPAEAASVPTETPTMNYAKTAKAATKVESPAKTAPVTASPTKQTQQVVPTAPSPVKTAVEVSAPPAQKEEEPPVPAPVAVAKQPTPEPAPRPITPPVAAATTTTVPKQKETAISDFFGDALAPPVKKEPPAPPASPPPSEKLTLKPSKSDDGSASASRTYARQQFLELKAAAANLSSVIKNIPDVVRKTVGYEANPFEAAGQQWDKQAGRGRGQQREPNIPPVKRQMQRTAEEDLHREVRGILNKLTPENFDSMTNRMHTLLNEQDERMKKVADKAKFFNEVVGIIFDKAISEPNLVETYAKMCTFLNRIEFLDKENKKVTFKKVMLNYCQREFEDHDHGTARQQELEELLAKAQTPEEKKSASEDLQEYKFVLKKKYLGNIRLISELYKTKELTLAIIIDCINRLLKEQDEETLECLCKLLRTIGKQFEEQVTKGGKKDQLSWWRHCIEVLESIVSERKMSSRIRFFVHDVLEARKDGWVFKQREAEGPKKISEIRSDLEREHAEKEKEAAKYRGTLSAQRGGRGGGQRGGQGQLPHIASTGQLRQVGQDGRGHESPSDIRSFGPVSIPTTTSTEQGNVALKPKWSVGSGSAWQKGAQTTAASSQQATSSSDEQRSRTPGEGSALAPGGRPSTGLSPAMLGVASGYRGARSLEKNRDPPQTTSGAPQPKRTDFSASMTRSVTGPLAQRPPQTRSSDVGLPSPTTVVEPMTDEQLSNSGTSLIAAYLRHKHMDDFVADAANALQQPNASVFVKSGIISGLENSENSTTLLSELFSNLVRSGRLQRSALTDGIVSVVDDGYDIEVDMPHFWHTLAKLLYHLHFSTQEGVQPAIEHSSFSAICASTKAENVDRLSEEFLQVVSKEQSSQQAGSFFRSAELDKYVSTGFLEKPSLSWLVKHVGDDDEAPEASFSTPSCHSPDHQTTSAPNLPEAHLASVLEKIFSSSYSPATEEPVEAQNDEVLDKITKAVNEQSRQSPRFIHELTKALCSTCLNGSDSSSELSDDHLNARLDVLKRFCAIENKKHCQAVLTGAHELVVNRSRPPQLLTQLFTIFSDKELVSSEDLLQWRDSKNSDGRGIDIKNMTSFFKSMEQTAAHS